MRNLGLVAAVVMLCSVTLVPAFSEDDTQGRDGKFDFEGYSNKTMSFGGYSNKTIEFDDSNQTDIGHEISDYIHKRNEAEKQQREDILAALRACRHQANESGNKTAMQQCIEDLKSSLKGYHASVMQQNLQFKQFRQDILSSNHTEISQDQNRQSMNQIMSEVSHTHAKAFAGTNHNSHKHGRHN